MGNRRSGPHEPRDFRGGPRPNRISVGGCHVPAVWDVQVVAAVSAARAWISNRVRGKWTLGPLSRGRSRPCLREGRTRGTVSDRGNRFHPIRTIRRRATAFRGIGVKNFVGVFGHVVMDYIVTLRRLPKPNTSIEILDRQRYFGGTGGNLARAAARLGGKASLASLVGGAVPARYPTELREHGVDTAHLRAGPRANSPAAGVFSGSRGHQRA